MTWKKNIVKCKRGAESNMLLDENNYKEQIHAFTQQDWKPLIELIPKVESTSKFGEWEEENILFPYCIGHLVEVAPPFDPTGNTALTGATLMFEILCVVAQSLSRR